MNNFEVYKDFLVNKTNMATEVNNIFYLVYFRCTSIGIRDRDSILHKIH